MIFQKTNRIGELQGNTASCQFPLGRIHPHGSGGKSVYQRAGSIRTKDGFLFESFFYGIGVVVGISSFAGDEVNEVGLVVVSLIGSALVFTGTD